MGNLFTKKKESRVTEQDKAVLVCYLIVSVVITNLFYFLISIFSLLISIAIEAAERQIEAVSEKDLIYYGER
jgi:threonine/homoserine efflux transporter RhtA